MQLTVVVHCDRPSFKVMPLIDSIYNQTVRDLDVWIACTALPSDLSDIQAVYPVGVLEFAGGTTPATMLNEAFARAQSDVVVTIDAAWMPRDKHWLLNLTRHFQDRTVAAVSGTEYDPERVSVREPWYAQDLLDFLANPEYSLHFGNAAFRRDVWKQLGFDSGNATCADKHWAYRALREGFQIMLDYDGRCHQGRAMSEEEQFRRYWAMNLHFGAFIQAQEDVKRLYQQALSATWRRRDLKPLARIYRMWGLIKQQKYWKRDATHAMLAREQFVRTGKKWAL